MMKDLANMASIKAKERNNDTPIIVLTANAIAGSEEEYLTLGFDGFLSKPIEYVKLEKMIQSLLPADKIQEPAGMNG